MAADLENSVLVYDVGGSHVSAAVCVNGAYRLGPVVSAPHPAEETSDAFIHLLYSLGVKALSGGAGVSGAELAVPGPFDFAAGISRMRHKLPYLYGVDLRGRLAERFGWRRAPCSHGGPRSDSRGHGSGRCHGSSARPGRSRRESVPDAMQLQ